MNRREVERARDEARETLDARRMRTPHIIRGAAPRSAERRATPSVFSLPRARVHRRAVRVTYKQSARLRARSVWLVRALRAAAPAFFVLAHRSFVARTINRAGPQLMLSAVRLIDGATGGGLRHFTRECVEIERAFRRYVPGSFHQNAKSMNTYTNGW